VGLGTVCPGAAAWSAEKRLRPKRRKRCGDGSGGLGEAHRCALAEARTNRTADRHYQPTQQRPTRGGDPALRRHVFLPGQDERRDQPRRASADSLPVVDVITQHDVKPDEQAPGERHLRFGPAAPPEDREVDALETGIAAGRERSRLAEHPAQERADVVVLASTEATSDVWLFS
jgi:hypothetical protein